MCEAAVQAGAMAGLVALASATSAARLGGLCATGAAAYSAVLLRAYVVGPTIGALSNRAAAAPLIAAGAALVALALRPTGLVARLAAVLLPLVTAGCAAHAREALRTLRSRFIYTEEAKALQIS